MDFDRAMEISGKFQEAYETLLRINGQRLEKRAGPYIGMIEHVIRREKCSSVEAVLIILKNWHNGSQTIPTSAMTLWLLASAVILEKKEIGQMPLFAG